MSEHNSEYTGSMARMLEKDFNKLNPDIIGLPEYFIVLSTGQIKIWPALDTSQVIFECHLV